jgi:hypothetical protein
MGSYFITYLYHYSQESGISILVSEVNEKTKKRKNEKKTKKNKKRKKEKRKKKKSLMSSNRIITDPQIHTKDGKGYGLGNMGTRGIERFLKTHVCNPICLQVGTILYFFSSSALLFFRTNII